MMIRIGKAITAVRWLVHNTNHNAPEFNSLFDALGLLIRAQELREQCSHEVRRDLCPDCAPDDVHPHRHSASCYRAVPLAEQLVGEVPPLERLCGYIEGEPERSEPRAHSHNAGCYMLGQRSVSYRTCGKLEGEPQ